MNKAFLQLAKAASEFSKDTSTKVGCAIITQEWLITGWNEFPRGVQDTPERRERPLKYKYTEHAEREAIYHAAREGYALKGGRMFLPWYPCADCARAIIQSGIAELICYEPNWEDPKWAEDFKVAKAMLTESGTTVTYEVP